MRGGLVGNFQSFHLCSQTYKFHLPPTENPPYVGQPRFSRISYHEYLCQQMGPVPVLVSGMDLQDSIGF